MTGMATFTPSCPAPDRSAIASNSPMAAAGCMTRRLIDGMFRPVFAQAAEDFTHDGAVLDIAGARLAFTTDTYVVRPLFFPGGDIGTLAVNGTVNDLAMCGAEPLYLSAGLVHRGRLCDRRPAPRRGIHAPCGRHAPACSSSPATPRSSSAARATASTSIRPASGDHRHRGRSRPDRCGPAMRWCSAATSAATASPSWRRARDLVSRPTITSDCAPLAAPVQRLARCRHRTALPARSHARRPRDGADRNRRGWQRDHSPR